MTYTDKDAERDAIALIEGPFCRQNHQSVLREQVAARLKRIVAQEVDDALEKRRRVRR